MTGTVRSAHLIHCPATHDVLRFVHACHVREGAFPYSLQPGTEPTLLGTCFAALVAHMTGATTRLKDASRIVDALASVQHGEDGLVRSPDLQPSDFLNAGAHSPQYLALQTTTFVRAALSAMGRPPSIPVRWAIELARRSRVGAWLDELDWNNPWLVSNLDMFLGIFLLEWRRIEPDSSLAKSAVAEYFGWHDANQNRDTGFWGSQQDPLNAMAGGYHIVLHYDYAGVPLQRIEQMIDAVLQLPWRDGLFVYGGGGGSCEDLDAVDLLVRLSLKSPHRATEVRGVLLRAARRIAEGINPDGGYSWRIVPTLGRAMSAVAARDVQLGLDIGTSWLYAMRTRSHMQSTHYYSSCRPYPYRIDRSDLWSTWFRPQALVLIARRYPGMFASVPDWRLPQWPGLGFDPWATHTAPCQPAALRA